MSDPIRRGWTSASNAAADALCQGRHLAQAGLSDSKGEWASKGTAIHEALKLNDASKLSLDERETFTACQSIEAKLVAAVFGEKQVVVSFREQRYWCKLAAPGVDVLEHSGQADVVYRSGTRALVLDYKTLQGDVADSPKNLQLRDLACLVKGHFVVVNEVATAIIQPLVTHSPDVCMYGEDDLKRAESEMFARVAASNVPNAPRSASEVACKFCLAKTRCPVYSAWIGGMIPTGNSEPLLKEVVFQTAMELWTPSQRALVAGLLSPAAKALDDIKDFLKSGIARDAQFVPGWTVSDGTKREVINDPQACFDRFSALGGKLPDFMGCVTVGKTKLKKAVNQVTGSIGRKLDGELGKLIEGIIDVSQTAGSLEKVSEK